MSLAAKDFPPGTPLHHFLAWNERQRRPDRRYRLLLDADNQPEELARALAAAAGNAGTAAHAAVFSVCEKLTAPYRSSRRILVIRLSAFGDFIQALGPFAAIRNHHRDDRVTLLTTRPYAAFAAQLGYFDEVIVDDRPGPWNLPGWLRLRRRLQQGRFDRVYDLQTSQRSARYAWLLRPGLPEWSGVAWRCSHPHANLGRDAQHTLDKQAEQLLMAGIYPTPAPALSPLGGALPAGLDRRDFALLVPGASPRHRAKRWPVARFAAVARALDAKGILPVVVGSAAEASLGRAIGETCTTALDLVGRTDLADLAVLAQHARLTIGNDTGVCHLAAAAGCPVIVLFSHATDPLRHAPRGETVHIIVAKELAGLPAETVIRDALSLLGDGERAPARPVVAAEPAAGQS